MTSIRDKFKDSATKLDILKDKVAEEDVLIPSGGGRAGYLDVDDGTNKFRLYPKKDGEDTFYQTKMVHWIDIEDEDDGTMKRKSVFNSRIHGGTEHDLFDEYMKAAREHLEADKDAEKASKSLKAMTHWKGGITGNLSWVCYAIKIKGSDTIEFGRLELKKSVRDDLNKEAMFEDPDEPITVDPFTDIDEGRPVLIIYDSKAKKAQDYYSVKVTAKALPLTDDQLEAFDKVDGLADVFRDCYRMSDFDLAVEGLRNFDEKNNIDLFDEPDWLETVKLVKAEVADIAAPEHDDDNEEEKIVDESAEEVVEEVVEEEEAIEEEEAVEEGDELDDMDRDGLKKHIVKNKLHKGDDGLKVKKSDSDDDIREKIRAAQSESVEEEEVVEDGKKEKKPTSLKDIKEKLKNK